MTDQTMTVWRTDKGGVGFSWDAHEPPPSGRYALVPVDESERQIILQTEGGEWSEEIEAAAARLAGWVPAGLPPMSQWGYESYRLAVIEAVLNALADDMEGDCDERHDPKRRPVG